MKMRNDIPAIFNHVTPQGRKIVNAKCECGHLQSSHADRFAPYHGACTLAVRKCKQFTWVSYVEVA